MLFKDFVTKERPKCVCCTHISNVTGYHCAPYVHELINDEEFSETVRIGIGQFNTEQYIDSLCEALE